MGSWCSSDKTTDTVYLEDKDLRQEYVLNDEGAIWVGDPTDYRTWSFGQGNGFDNDGLLEGNWSGEYQGGTSPTKWRGSVKIMQQFWKTKAPVKYGQCWVFSGVLTTMCRAIGIPCRSITNYSSAHDTDRSITIDRVFNIEGVKESNDSTWNFHVWNEVWMRRPDIPKGKYDGWQAIDCTPQERVQCGPMPVAAMKEGDLSYNYDGAFIFAEVNADIVTWVNGRDGQPYLSDIERQRVGRDISTRKPGDSKVNVREDITDAYKYKEGNLLYLKMLQIVLDKDMAMETLFFKEIGAGITKMWKMQKRQRNGTEAPRLFRNTSTLNPSSNMVNAGVKFFLERTEDDDYGKDFIVKLRARNTIEKPQSIYGHITIHSSDYTGKQINFLRTESFEEILEPKKEDKELQLRVTFEDYMGKLVDGCYVSAVCCFVTKETRQASITQDMIWLKKPRLHLKLSSRAIEKGEPFVVKMGFTNPLKIPLTNCYLDIEGSGIEAVDEKQLSDLPDVGPNERFVAQVEVKATKKGYRRINAVFNAAEMYGVSGATGIRVKVSSATPT
ncbi:hypothetical protein FSP39_022591 [Pinctada imbricata]|uniref:Transglutaminase-like domain-containing protein n=1 Tax=Pinctada imbricata TaxID=66713 RepID=A0AA89BME8_PINIB|nr:hypothetical protein FSP39_022591 [Pinctada imbricata]